MIGQLPELLRSLNLQPTMDKVQRGTVLDYAQYSVLRDSADAKLHLLLSRVHLLSPQRAANNLHGEEELRKLQEACLRACHLLQTSCLALRRLELDCNDQRLAR